MSDLSVKKLSNTLFQHFCDMAIYLICNDIYLFFNFNLKPCMIFALYSFGN